MSRPFRHTLILVGAAVGTALAAFGGWRYARASAPLSGPVIVISVDALRSDHLPAYGYKKIATPEIDRLAADSVVFTRAYSHSPQTLPAHVALLSGRLPFETGVRDDEGMRLKSNERLLPQMLADRGYQTAAVVSTPLLGKSSGIAAKFGSFDADFIGRERDGAETEHLAERWLTKIGTSRAFLFIHLNEPNAPYAPPDRFSQYAPYDGEIAYVDEIVGRLVHYLKSHQLYDRSTIVLLGDHGEGLGDHGEQGHGLFVYEEALHVPLIVKQESNVDAGRRVDEPVQHVDLAPTILDLAKAPIPGNLRGQSLKPLLDGASRLGDRVVYAESLYGYRHFGWAPLASATDGRYRYVSAPREELYDIRTDRFQRTNVFDAAGARRERTTLADILHGESGAMPADAAALPDPKDKVAVLEAYRRALAFADDRKWSAAIPILQSLVRDEPDLVEVWRTLASTASAIDRFDTAIDASRHVLALAPSDPAAHVAAATILLRARRLDDAREQAEQILDVAASSDVEPRVEARMLLARIALATRDAQEARAQAENLRTDSVRLPLTPYVEGRLLYDQGKYDEAAAFFDEAVMGFDTQGAPPIPGLHFYAGDTFVRLGRTDEGEAQLVEELRHFPDNIRARAALAASYHATGQLAAAEQTLADLTEQTPTPDAYALAARMWKSFGNAKKANGIAVESQKVFSRKSSVASH